MTNQTPTYHEADFRTYPAEWLHHNSSVELLSQVCESLEEDGRWEGFVSIKAARRNGQPISVREALRG